MRTKLRKNEFIIDTGMGGKRNNWCSRHRICKKFLIFPKTIDNERRWLETAKWEEMYQDNPFMYPSDGGPYMEWVAIKWIDLEKESN